MRESITDVSPLVAPPGYRQTPPIPAADQNARIVRAIETKSGDHVERDHRGEVGTGQGTDRIDRTIRFTRSNSSAAAHRNVSLSSRKSRPHANTSGRTDRGMSRRVAPAAGGPFTAPLQTRNRRRSVAASQGPNDSQRVTRTGVMNSHPLGG